MAPELVRDALTVVLTVGTGGADAISFLRLGGVFSSVMTANMVLLGISVGRQDGALAIHTGAAFAGFVLGSLLGARIAGAPTSGQGVWPPSVTRALAVELLVFVAVTLWWEFSSTHPSGPATYALLGINAGALGIQSGAILRLGVPGLSTTYLTGTLTQLLASVSNRDIPFSPRSVAVLAALVTGGILGAVAVITAPRVAPVIPLCAVTVALATASVVFGRAGRRMGVPRESPRGHS